VNFSRAVEIDGKKVYGAAIYTERGSEGITMGGYQRTLQLWLSSTKTLISPMILRVFVNSEGAVEGLEFYKAMYDCCTPPGASDAYMSQNIDAYKSGQVAMQMKLRVHLAWC